MSSELKTLIVSGGSFDKEFVQKFLGSSIEDKYAYVISVDKGTEYAEELGIVVDLVVGDFDSVNNDILQKYDEQRLRRYKVDKNDTDTEIAIREAVKLGNDIDIICGTGGRIDHLLGNIHILKIALESGVEARLIDRSNIIFLKNKSFTVKKGEWVGKYISLIPFSGNVLDIKLKGFKYPLDGYDLKPGITRCISNEIVEDIATVDFEYGCLIVINSLDVESE